MSITLENWDPQCEIFLFKLVRIVKSCAFIKNKKVQMCICKKKKIAQNILYTLYPVHSMLAFRKTVVQYHIKILTLIQSIYVTQITKIWLTLICVCACKHIKFFALLPLMSTVCLYQWSHPTEKLHNYRISDVALL